MTSNTVQSPNFTRAPGRLSRRLIDLPTGDLLPGQAAHKSGRSAIPDNGAHPPSPQKMNRRQPSVTLLQASQNHASLAKLMELNRASKARFDAIATLIPDTLRPNVTAGPLTDGVWCLLLSNTTTAAKLRQLLPAFEAHLRVHQLEVKSIRLKVSGASGSGRY